MDRFKRDVRNLDAGPGGNRRRPMSDARYEVFERNTAGFGIQRRVTSRFVTRIRQKAAEGLALP